MENFNKLIPIDGENGEKRTISSLQIAEITGKAYCGVLKVIRKMDIMRVKITMKNIFSLFVCLKKCCTFVVLQLTIKYANGIFYARKETYILKYRQTISVYHRPIAMVGCSKLGYLPDFRLSLPIFHFSPKEHLNFQLYFCLLFYLITNNFISCYNQMKSI